MLSQPFQADTNERASAGGDSTCVTAPPAKSLSAHRAPDPPSPTATRRLVRPTRVTSGTGTDTVSPAGTLGTQKTAAVDPVLEWPDLSGAGGKAPTRQGQTGVQQTLAGMELFDPAAKDAGGLSEDARKTWGEGFKSVSAKPAQEGSLQRWWEGVKYASRSEPAGQAVLGPGQAGATASTSTSASGQVTAVTTGPKSATPRVGGISDQPLTETISSSGSTAHAETSKELAVPVLKAEPDTDQRLEVAPTQNAAHTLRAVEQRIASTLGPSDNQSPTRYAEAVARCCAPATTTPMGKAQGAKKRKVNVTPAPADARQTEALDREEKRVKLEHAESATDSATGSGSSSVPITPAASTLATATTAPGNVIVTASHPSHPLLKGKVPGSKAYRKAERQILAAQMAQDARAANAQASGSTVVPAAVSYSSAPPSAQSGGGRADVNPVGVSAATRTPAIGTASTSVGMTTTTAKKIPTGPAAQTRASVANANAAGIPSVAQKAPAAPRLQTGVAGTSMNLAPANDVAGKKGDVADSRRRQDIAQKVNASVSGANDAMSTGAGYDRMEVDGGDGRSSGVRADVEHDKVSGAAAVLLSTTTGSLQPTPPTSDRHATSAPCPTPASINASTAPGGSAAQVAPVPTPRPPVNLKQVTTQLAKLHAAVNAFELDIKAAEADSDREKAANEQGLASAKAEAEAAKVAAAEARAEGGRATAELDKMRAAAMAWMKRAKAAEAKVMRLEDADKVAVAAKVVADGELRDIKEKLEESERRGNAAVKNLALVKASLKLRDESWKPGCFDVGGVDVSAAPSAASSRSGTGVAGQPAGRATPVGLVSALEIGTATPPVHQSTTLETPATTSAPANTDLIALRRSLLLARTDLSKEQKRSSALQQQIDTQAGEIKLLESDLAETKRQARMGELRASIVAREHDKRVARLNEEREVQLKELEAMMRVIEALEGELRSKEGDGTGGTESGTMDQET